MAIPEGFLADLKSRCEIENVISDYVQLRRRGNTHVGLCPFHSEKTGSFTVFTDTQSYYCFGCGAGGDVITFVRAIEHLDYIDAVKMLANKAGLQMPEEERDSGGMARELIFRINRDAARFFYDSLAGPKGTAAREYIAKRNLDIKTIKKFGIGFAPEGWDNLLLYLKSKGYKPDQIKTAGLAVKGRQESFYDYFRNRLMIPIFDVRGNVIAFGGRVMDSSQPKYLNSPDTPVFKKSSSLFNLNNAKNTGAGRLILAEGYLDVISLAQAGFEEAVATLGTAITEEQARIMARYAGEGGVVIAYDSDEAGQKATYKAINHLENAGVRVRVLRMTGSKDPDEYINTFGAVRFKQLIDGSGNQIEFKLSGCAAKYDLAAEGGKLSYLKEAVPILAAIPNATTRDIYAGRISKETDVSKEAVLSEIASARKNYVKKQKNDGLKNDLTQLSAKRDRINPEKADKMKAARAEEGVISILFYNPELCSVIAENLAVEDFVTEFNRRIYKAVRDIIEFGGVPDTALLGAEFSTEEMGRITAILNLKESFNGIDQIKKALFDYTDCILAEKTAMPSNAASALTAAQLDDYIKKGLSRKKGGKVNEDG